LFGLSEVRLCYDKNVWALDHSAGDHARLLQIAAEDCFTEEIGSLAGCTMTTASKWRCLLVDVIYDRTSLMTCERLDGGRWKSKPKTRETMTQRGKVASQTWVGLQCSRRQGLMWGCRMLAANTDSELPIAGTIVNIFYCHSIIEALCQ